LVYKFIAYNSDERERDRCGIKTRKVGKKERKEKMQKEGWNERRN
jgi:hypothetical protein